MNNQSVNGKQLYVNFAQKKEDRNRKIHKKMLKMQWGMGGRGATYGMHPMLYNPQMYFYLQQQMMYQMYLKQQQWQMNPMFQQRQMSRNPLL